MESNGFQDFHSEGASCALSKGIRVAGPATSGCAFACRCWPASTVTLERVATAADFAMRELAAQPRDWLFINPDLTIHVSASRWGSGSDSSRGPWPSARDGISESGLGRAGADRALDQSLLIDAWRSTDPLLGDLRSHRAQGRYGR